MDAPGLELDDLRIAVRDEGGVVVAEWSGTGDTLEPSRVLVPFLDRLARESVGKTLTLDLRGLQFINSATMTPILMFVRQLDRLKVETRVVYAAQAHWQRVHFNCMKTISNVLRHIKVELA